ncbi:MAG: hypothetical protein AB9897_03395 [Anaerolineaceae bacterium]
MAPYDFSALESKFAQTIEKLPDPFDSHQFLTALAQKNQKEYVSALYSYKDYLCKGNPAPFQGVHTAIIQKLASHTELVVLIRDNKPSKDIWGNSNNCGEWKKVKKG